MQVPNRCAFLSSLPATPRRAAAAALLLLLTTAVPPAFALTADSADDLCAADADPCTVTGVVDVAGGAVLDLGRRELRLTGDGQLAFGTGSATIRFGSLQATSRDPALRAGGAVGVGVYQTGTVRLEARRGCSAGPAPVTCEEDAQCQLGACAVRRCSGDAAATCTSDAGCQLGTCGTNRLCSAAPTPTRCDTNADCDLGTCPAQLTCAGMANIAVACASEADCQLGTCSVGDASIRLDAPVDGSGELTANLELAAVDSVTIREGVNLASRSIDLDGGRLEVTSAQGDVVLAAPLQARGGTFGKGGTLVVDAARDAFVEEPLMLSGGDSDGGDVELLAGRDVILHASVSVASTAGAGYGGTVALTAGRDVVVTPGPEQSSVRLSAGGHSEQGFAGGDGGEFAFSAGGNVTIGSRVRMSAGGAAPDGYAGSLLVDALGDVLIEGDVFLKSKGKEGGGGVVEVLAEGSVTVAAGADLRSSGGDGGGGFVDIASAGPLTYAGRASVAGTVAGSGAALSLQSEDDLEISGTLLVGGKDPATSIDVEACRVRVLATADVRNLASGGTSTISAHESMSLLAGSKLRTQQGSNVLVYRTAAKPPLVGGLVDTPAQLVEDPLMGGCPVCGNGEIDEDETCDDGNTEPDDGCDEFCELE